VLAWGIAVVVVAGLMVPAFVVTEAAGRPASEDFQRYGPIQPGSTAVFDTISNGKKSGLLFEQVVGPAQVVFLDPNTVALSDHFDDFVGSGQPRDIRSYIALRDDEVLNFGQRIDAGSFQESDPPQVMLQAPLEKGASWSWKGTRGSGTGRSTTTIVDIADRRILGQTFDDCLHLRVQSEDTDDQGNTSTDVQDTWQCPDVGAVETKEVFKQGDTTIRFESHLVEVHSPGVNLPAPSAASQPAAPPRTQAGSTFAVDQGHTWSVPGATLSTDRLAWTVARKGDGLYPPVGAGDDLITEDDDGTICSTNLRTGQVNWQVRLVGPIVASPVVAGDMVLVADAAKSLWALDLATGRARWALDLPDVVSATPAVVGRIAVVPIDNLEVRGFDVTTGEQRWSMSTQNLVTSPPVVANGLVIVGDRAGNLTALRPDDGETVWSDDSILLFSGGTVLLGGLTASGDTLAAATDGTNVFVYQASTGHLEWRGQARNTIDRAVAIAGDRIVVASQSTVEVLDADDGRLIWQRRTGTTFAPPVVIGDTIAVLEIDNRLLEFDLTSGDQTSIRIHGPDNPSGQDTRIAMAWTAGALVVPTHNVGPWPFVIYQAFPAPVASADAPKPLGVRPAGEAYVFETAPSGPPSLQDGALYTGTTQFEGSKVSGSVVESQAGGPFDSPLRTLERTDDPPAFAIASGDRVLTQSGNSILGIPIGGGGKTWTANGSQLLPGTIPLLVPAGGGGASPTLVYPDPDRGLIGLDAATGESRWGPVAKPAIFGSGSPVLLPDGDVVWSGGGLTKVDPADGRIVQRNTDVSPLSSVAQSDGRLFGVFAAGNKSALAGVDGDTLQPVWARPFSSALILGALPVTPGAGDGVVAVVDAGLRLRVFDAGTGKPMWSLQLRMAPNAVPVVWDGRIYVEEPGITEDLAQHEHRLTVLDAATGQMEAVWELPGSNFSADLLVRSGDRLLAPVPTGVIAIHPEER
jgi:outer membrane protein assembly factor BamB